MAISIRPDIVLVSGDWHLGEHDPAAICALFQTVIELQPATIVLAGDILDCCELHKSQLGRRAVAIPHRSALTMEAELATARVLLQGLRAVAPKARIVYLEGNHELRWNRTIASCLPHLSGLAPDLKSLLQLSELQIEWLPHGQALYLLDTAILHGTRTNIHAARTAMLDWRQTVIQGHSHRLKMYSATSPNGKTIYGVEAGHLRSQKASYTPLDTPDWQAGFCLLTRAGKSYFPTLVPVVAGQAILPGRVIEVGPKEVRAFWGKVERLVKVQTRR